MVDAIVVRQEIEWIIWPVASMSIYDMRKKMEWERLGGNQKGLPEKLAKVRHGWTSASSSSCIRQRR